MSIVNITGANPGSCNPVKRVGSVWVCEGCGTPHKTVSAALYNDCTAKREKEVPHALGSLVVIGPET